MCDFCARKIPTVFTADKRSACGRARKIQPFSKRSKEVHADARAKFNRFQSGQKKCVHVLKECVYKADRFGDVR